MGWFEPESSEDIFGRKPEVAGYKSVNLQREQERALKGNLANFDLITALGEEYKDYQMAQLEDLLPGFGNILETGAENTQAMLDAAAPLLRGELPDDVQAAVFRNSAQRSLLGGFAGSGMSRSLTARDLGRTSLDMMRFGADLSAAGGNSAQRWSGLAGQSIMSPNALLTTPQQQAAITADNNARQQAVEQMRFNVEAAPDPEAAGKFNTFMSLAGMAASMYGGGMGGGSTYQAPTGGANYGITAMSQPYQSGPQGGVPQQTFNSWQPGPQEGTYYVPQRY
jgi:hypothetical protein